MKLSDLFIYIVLLLTTKVWSQNPSWALPNNTLTSSYYTFGTGFESFPTSDPILGISYTGIFPSNPAEDGYNPSYIQHRGAANAIANPTGELLFFIVGNNILNKLLNQLTSK